MAFWNRKQVKESGVVDLEYHPTLSYNSNIINLTEQFKGEVEKKDVKFPNELGEEHPFDFKQLEELYRKFGYFTAVVDKYVDYVVGPGFYIDCKDARAKEIIEQFIIDVNLDTMLRAWCKEALVKGNGFLEIGGDATEGIKGLKVLNANYMYVQRDKFGKVLGYNQYKGAFNKFDKEKLIPFKVENIAHIPFNVVGDCAYGMGIGYSALLDVNNLLQDEKDCHEITHRKANSPLHAKLGKVDGNVKIIPKKEDVEAFGQKMETMDNKTNWATDDLVSLSVVDFGNIGDKFNAILKQDMDKLISIFQIPAVLMGQANVNEGIAKVQMEGFQRRIQSIQAELEKIIEQQIFKRVLNANGFVKDAEGTEVEVEFEWGTPSIMEVEGRIATISELVKSPTTSPALKIMLEDEMINMLKLDKDEWEKNKLEQEAKMEEERKRLEGQPQPIVPGQNKSFPQKVQPKPEQPKQPTLTSRETMEPLLAMLIEMEEKRNKAMLDMEQRRNDLLVEQENKRNKILEEQEQKRLTQEKEKEKENKIREEQKIEKVVAPVEKKKENIFNRIMNKRKNLLPEFKITKRTEAVEKIEEPKVEFKKREKANYECEKECQHCLESWNDVNDINEWLGFKYKDYLAQILANVKDYDFSQIKAGTANEVQAGYLTQSQIDELKAILENGFKKGLSMKDMAKEIDRKLELKDLYRMTEDGDIKKGAAGLPILQKSKDNRSIGIVRSEVTRLANMGAVDYYKQNDISKIKWVASFGDRTCPDCEALNGQIYEIGMEPEMPLHPMCRCTYAPVVELK